MARRGNFDVLGKYAWCIPSVADIFILIFLLLLGSLIGSGVVLIATLCVGAENSAAFASEYTTLISYPIMFIPPMPPRCGPRPGLSPISGPLGRSLPGKPFGPCANAMQHAAATAVITRLFMFYVPFAALSPHFADATMAPTYK